VSVSVDFVDKQFARAVPLDTLVITITSVSVEVVLPAVVVVVDLFVQVQVLSFLQDAKLKAATAKANSVIFFIVCFLKSFTQI
jgi:hypothetical protein